MHRRSCVIGSFAVLVLVGCGGKIASEGSSGVGAPSSSSSASSSSGDPGYPKPPDPTPEPTPTPDPAPGDGARPVAFCPASPPPEGDGCSWDYGFACHYDVHRGNVCSVQCTCFGGRDTNHWTCFDVPCEP